MKYELMINSNIVCVPQPQNIGAVLDNPAIPIESKEKTSPNFMPKNLNLRKNDKK